MTGSFGVTDFTEEEGCKVAPKAVVLNDLIGVMDQSNGRRRKKSWELLVKLHTVLKGEFKLQTMIERKPA